MLKEDLRTIIDEQKIINIKKKLIQRETKINTNTSLITIVSGIRRCGKSTLLFQNLDKNKKIGYLNFEDPRLVEFNVQDFLKVEEIFSEEKINTFFFDEIQNIPEWERYIRLAHDKGKKIFITGSNASMLSRELGTKLTGRHKQIELFPFSFNEYLLFTNQKKSANSLSKYIEFGGFPEYLKEKDDEYHIRLFDSILSRDILVRMNIRSDQIIFNLANFIISNAGKLFSFNKLTKKLGIKSVRTTIDYCNYLQQSYLIEFVSHYSFSITKQIINPKKVYVIDSALIKINSLSFSKDVGRVLENIVYFHLRRRFQNIYYFKEEYECDFLVKEKNEIVLAIQVCYNINKENIERELLGLNEALQKTNAKKGFIITYDLEDEIEGIKLIPAWKFLSDYSYCNYKKY